MATSTIHREYFHQPPQNVPTAFKTLLHFSLFIFFFKWKYFPRVIFLLILHLALWYARLISWATSNGPYLSKKSQGSNSLEPRVLIWQRVEIPAAFQRQVHSERRVARGNPTYQLKEAAFRYTRNACIHISFKQGNYTSCSSRRSPQE